MLCVCLHVPVGFNPQEPVTLFYETGSLTWPGARIRLGWLASDPQLSPPPRCWVIAMATILAFICNVSSGDQTQSQHLNGEHFTD